MIEVSKSGRFMLVGDSIVSVENLMSVEVEETVSDIADSVENSSGESISEMFKDIKQKVTTSAMFGIDGGGQRKVIKVGAEQLAARGVPDKQLGPIWDVLKNL